MSTPRAVARRRRPPLHWKIAVSVRKRWHRLRRLWRADRAVEDCHYFGASFKVAPDDLIGREMLLQRFEWLQIPAMLEACQQLRPAAFIDIGANFGLYTCIIGKQGVARRLIAFEPNREIVAQRLRAHIALNSLSRVEIHEIAAGARTHKAALALGAPGYDALSSVVEKSADGYAIDVAPLDDLLEFDREPLVIKIDVEGYEPEVLQGAQKLFRKNYGYAQIESFEEPRASAVIDTMAQFGWRLADHIVDDLIFRRDAGELG